MSEYFSVPVLVLHTEFKDCFQTAETAYNSRPDWTSLFIYFSTKTNQWNELKCLQNQSITLTKPSASSLWSVWVHENQSFQVIQTTSVQLCDSSSELFGLFRGRRCWRFIQTPSAAAPDQREASLSPLQRHNAAFTIHTICARRLVRGCRRGEGGWGGKRGWGKGGRRLVNKWLQEDDGGV